MGKWSRVSTTPERIKQALSNAGMKQVELSKLTGIDKGSISNYLAGRYEPKADAINKMAKALNVNEMWLWGYDVQMERETSQKSNSPDKLALTEGEQVLLDLFKKVPEDKQKIVIEMIRAALRTQE